MNLLLPSYSILIITLLIIAFFSKERMKSDETSIYGQLLIISGFNIIFNLCGIMLGYTQGESSFLYLLNHFDLPLYFLWASLLFLYLLYVCLAKVNLNLYLKIKKTIYLIDVIGVIITIFLPIKIVINKTAGFAIGACVNFVYAMSGVYLLLSIATAILLIKKNRLIKTLPVFMLLLLGVVAATIQKIVPSLIIVPAVIVFVELLMYFTIENPDMKMVDELVENRKIIERSSEEKSIFLFKMSQGIKEPSKNIEKEITRYEEEKNTKEKVDNIIQNIDRENGKINYLVNDVMGLTSFDGSKIKKVEGSYNIYSLLEDIKIRAKGYKKNDIDYTFTTVENIPKELIGDRVAIKQVLMSLIINAFNNTSKGYVHVDVNSITKYDVCRLVITIEDSGSGIEINKINEILNQEEELTNEEYLKLDKIDIDLPLSYKIIKSLGGTMYIRSEVGKGTSITITLDQYIIEDEDEKRSKRIEEYIEDKNSLGKILLVDDNEKEISKIKKYLNKKGYDVSLVMYGEEVIKRIKDKEKYDYIMIDDELETMSGISLLKELNKEKDKSKKIVILDKDKLFISDHYIEDGFNDYIDRENLIKELDRLF